MPDGAGGAGGVDTSNMGRCVLCGEPIDMRDAGDELIVVELPVPDHPAIDEADIRESMADVLRRYQTVADCRLASAFESGGEVRMHGECHDRTSLPELFDSAAAFDEWEPDE